METKTDFYRWLAETGGTLPEVKEYLKELSVDPMALTPRGWNMLHMAVQKGGNLEVVKYLKELGVDPMALTPRGKNMLHLAVQKGGNLEVVKYLKELGLNL